MLIKYHGNADPNSPVVAMEYEEICQTLAFEKTVQSTNFKACFASRPNRWRLGCAIAVGVFCQLSGNNTITYYLGTVLDTAGITEVQTQLAINIGLSVSNLIFAIIGSLFIDRIGRRAAFLCSTGSMALTLVVNSVLTKLYAASSYNTSASGAIVFLIFFFYGFYSLAWTPLSYLYPIEVLSYSLRANGLSIFNGAIYLAAFFNLYAIPYAMAWSGWGFYLISAGWCGIECLVMWWYFPETRRMTLEEVDVIFDGQRHVDGAVLTLGEVVEVKLDGEKGFDGAGAGSGEVVKKDD